MLKNVRCENAPWPAGYRPSAAELLHEILRYADVHKVTGGEVLILPLGAGLYEALACFDLDGDPDVEPNGDREFSLGTQIDDVTWFDAARRRRLGLVPAIHRNTVRGKTPKSTSRGRVRVITPNEGHCS